MGLNYGVVNSHQSPSVTVNYQQPPTPTGACPSGAYGISPQLSIKDGRTPHRCKKYHCAWRSLYVGIGKVEALVFVTLATQSFAESYYLGNLKYVAVDIKGHIYCANLFNCPRYVSWNWKNGRIYSPEASYICSVNRLISIRAVGGRGKIRQSRQEVGQRFDKRL